MEIFGTNVALDKTAMHIAPGGSTGCLIKGERTSIGEFLSALREEIAFGMHHIEVIDASTVCVGIHYGSADEDCFKDMLLKSDGSCAWSIETESIAEGSVRDALTMSTRNKVINALS